MFGFFKSTCPIHDDAKWWVDDRMSWLADQFGWQRMYDVAVVTPAREHFPDQYSPSEKYLRQVLVRFCDQMGIDSRRVRLKTYSDSTPIAEQSTGLNTFRRTATGRFEQEGQWFNVWLNRETLIDPPSVAATITHELAHVLLLGENRITDECEDHEPLTDLLTVFLGVGIFNANAVVRDLTIRVGTYEAWSIGKQGYLTMPIFGYALAYFAYARGEQKPQWAKHLRLDVRVPFWQSLRYLRKTGDCTAKVNPKSA